MTDICSFRECKHRTGTCSSLTTCCWWPSKSEYRDNDTCSINSLMYKLSNFKLKNLQTLSDPAQLSNLSTESESVSCG